MRKAKRAAARRGRHLRIMFADEARFGRINRPRPCWAPIGIRPKVASQLIREYIYLYGAVSPKDGTCIYLIMPTSNTACFQAFLNLAARKFAGQDILLVLDGAPNHRCGDLVLPDNISLLFLAPYGPELNPRGKSVGLQKLCPQIHRRRARQTQGGDPLHGTQARNCKIHHLIPLHSQVTLMWKWYHIEPVYTPGL